MSCVNFPQLLEVFLCIFYDNLKAICDEKRVKITPIVNECGGVKGSISNWKKDASPNSDIIVKLAVCLNVSTDLLIFGKKSSTTSPEFAVASEYTLIENEEELLRVFKNLPIRERVKLLSAVYDFEEQYRKTNK